MDMTLEEQGAYRNLLDEAHLRGGPLPNDERILAKACGDALAWPRVRSTVLARFNLLADGWHNETLDEVYTRTIEISRERTEAGRLGGLRSAESKRQAKQQANAIVNGQAKRNSPSPSPSPSPDLVSVSGLKAKEPQQPEKLETTGRSKRPIYTSDRFAVFEWQLDELGRMLGSHLDDFDLHRFFDDLSQSSRTHGLVIPKDDAWKWLQAQVLAEAKRRGLPMASAKMTPIEEKRAADERTRSEAEWINQQLHAEDALRAKGRL